jgi:hypothetical protein
MFVYSVSVLYVITSGCAVLLEPGKTYLYFCLSRCVIYILRAFWLVRAKLEFCLQWVYRVFGYFWRRLLCSVNTSETIFGFWVLVGPSKNARCSHEREFLFILLPAPTKTKNSEQNWKLRAKWETGKHRPKWDNIDHNGLAPSKKSKLRAKLAKLANICTQWGNFECWN